MAVGKVVQVAAGVGMWSPARPFATADRDVIRRRLRPDDTNERYKRLADGGWGDAVQRETGNRIGCCGAEGLSQSSGLRFPFEFSL